MAASRTYVYLLLVRMHIQVTGLRRGIQYASSPPAVGWLISATARFSFSRNTLQVLHETRNRASVVSVYRRLSPKSVVTVDFLSLLWPHKM